MLRTNAIFFAYGGIMPVTATVGQPIAESGMKQQIFQNF